MPRSGWRLGRYLASCGRLFGDNKTLTHYKRNEVREMVRAYFQAQLDQYLHWLDIRGLSKNALEDVRCEMLDHESYLDMEMDSDMHLPVKRFVRKSWISGQDWQESPPAMRQELRKGRRDMLSRVLEAAESLDCGAAFWMSLRVASRQDVPDRSCCCLNRMFPADLVRRRRIVSAPDARKPPYRAAHQGPPAGARLGWCRTQAPWPRQPSRFSDDAALCGATRQDRRRDGRSEVWRGGCVRFATCPRRTMPAVRASPLQGGRPPPASG